MAIVTTIGLMFSIVFHEMSHSLVARRYGLPIRGITLFVFGGVAEMEDEPTNPKGEFWMAVAGPAASLVLSAIFFILTGLGIGWHAPRAVTATLRYLAFINGMLAIFNLIPAFPLDGGRMLRAALWYWRGDVAWATRIAATAGEVLGIALMVLGVIYLIQGYIIGGIWWILIGMFVRGAAEASYRQTMTRKALESVPVARVMTRRPIAVPPETSVASFIEDFVYGYHHRTFPVTADDALIGSVGTNEVARLDRSAWAATPIKTIMVPTRPDDVVTPQTPTLTALAQMQRTGRSRLWVVDQGRLVGVVSLHDVVELLSARLELEHDQHQHRAA